MQKLLFDCLLIYLKEDIHITPIDTVLKAVLNSPVFVRRPGYNSLKLRHPIVTWNCISFQALISVVLVERRKRAKSWHHVIWLEIVFVMWHMLKVVRSNNRLYPNVLRDCWHFGHLIVGKAYFFVPLGHWRSCVCVCLCASLCGVSKSL